MPRKFFSNEPGDIVSDVLKGMKYAHPGLHFSVDNRVVLLNRDRGERVAILAGSGGGHEPYPVGFIGENMLTGCVVGDLFTAPTVPSMLSAILNLSKYNRGGVLIIGLNYTGDSLNWWLAARRAIEAGVKVGVIIVADDVAADSPLPDEGHRSMAMKKGLFGAIMCAKIVGAMSNAGFTLEEILLQGSLVPFRTATISCCYEYPSHCQLPKMNENEIVIGTGAHGEGGLKRIKMAPLKEIVRTMVEQIFTVFLSAPKDRVVLTINDSGVCTDMELFILAREVGLQLASKVTIVKTFVGRFFTSLDMKGFQISITNIEFNEVWLDYVNMSTEAFAWPGNSLAKAGKEEEREFSVPNFNKFLQDNRWKLSYDIALIFGACIQATCNSCRKYESDLNSMDTLFGQGDFGTKIKVFAERVLKDVKGASLLMDLPKTFLFMAQIAEEEIHSIFGTVLSLLFTGASKGTSWWSAWREALHTLSKYSTARLYHRTILDGLVPSYRGFKSVINEQGPAFWESALVYALRCAEIGSEETIRMRPKTWIELHGTKPPFTPKKENGPQDPGAYLVVIWLRSILGEISKKQRQVLIEPKNIGK